MPTSAQIVTRRLDETLALRVGRFIETAVGAADVVAAAD
jgi:hypothetical protein